MLFRSIEGPRSTAPLRARLALSIGQPGEGLRILTDADGPEQASLRALCRLRLDDASAALAEIGDAPGAEPDLVRGLALLMLSGRTDGRSRREAGLD